VELVIEINKEKLENIFMSKEIKTFQDLIVYQNLYRAMKIILTKIIPQLPKEEKFDLADQLRRSCKAAPAILAEGFAKRYQKANWKKYLDDVLGEINEVIHHLSVCLDIYPQRLDVNLIKELVKIYDITARQITSLKKSWQNFHDNKNK